MNSALISVIWIFMIQWIFSECLALDIKSWTEFKKEYGKKYVSKEEEFHRRKIFLENLLYIGKSIFQFKL